jgi:hypothetical protein
MSEEGRGERGLGFGLRRRVIKKTVETDMQSLADLWHMCRKENWYRVEVGRKGN